MTRSTTSWAVWGSRLDTQRALDALSARLGVDFGDPSLLRLAVTHRSWCAENGVPDSNERLEFLGDAVLELVVTACLYRTYPTMTEGELAKVRASVVNTGSLAEAAAGIELGAAMLLGRGEHATGGREKASILADGFEAVLGAVYLDGGWAAAESLVMRLLAERLEEAALGPGGDDYKTRLQEHAAQRYEELPRYVVTDEGPDHDKHFTATVQVGGKVLGAGEGSSKKQAEQAAARVALEREGVTAGATGGDDA